MTHTPTPWTKYESSLNSWIGNTDTGEIVADKPNISTTDNKDRWSNNAQFIRTACNAHEELVRILQKLSSLAPSSEGLGGHAPLSAFIQLASEARKVLNTIEKGV